MATTPFGAVLEALLKDPVQGGQLFASAGAVVNPRFGCCKSGNAVGVAKDPIAKLHVSPLQGCAHNPPTITGTTFTADASNSYSPTSTISSYEISWGDGASTGPLAWPPAPQTHQYTIGGVDEPIAYTITLTVTDMLIATGVDTVQVFIGDCTVWPGIELFAGCGASGVWYSENGARNWSAVGLEGVKIYDLKANLFSLTYETGSRTVELWAATEDGLYRTVNSADSWQLVPLEAGYIPYTVLPSPVLDGEIYVLAYNVALTTVKLFRSVDSGDTWTSVGITESAPTLWDSGGGGHWDRGRKIAGIESSSALAVNANERGTRWTLGTTWADHGGDVNENMAVDTDFQGGITVRATCGDNGAYQRINGAWVLILAGAFVDIDAEWGFFLLSDTAVTQVVAGVPVPNSPWNLPGGVGNGRHLIVIAPGGIFFVGTDGGRILRGTIDGLGNVTWVTEWMGGHNVQSTFAEYTQGINQWLFAAMGTTRLLCSDPIGAPGVWNWDTFICPEAINCVYGGLTAGSSLFVGTDTAIYRRDEVLGVYVKVSTLDNVERIYSHIGVGGEEIIYAVTSSATDGIYKIKCLGALSIPTEGCHHLLSMSWDGLYIFMALLESGQPVIYRIPYDLSAAATLIYDPDDGTWGGVVCDFNVSGRVWIFGDFGAGDKVQVSDDYGDTLTNVTDAGWGAAEVVRPLLLDYFSTSGAVAILNAALEIWKTGDGASTWEQVGDGIASGVLPFDSQCGVLDWFDQNTILVGRAFAGANHLQLTVSGGLDWAERSIGITANAPIAAIVITT